MEIRLTADDPEPDVSAIVIKPITRKHWLHSGAGWTNGHGVWEDWDEVNSEGYVILWNKAND